MNGERLAAALEFDRKRRAQDYLMSEPGTQPLTRGEDVLGFLRGVGGNLAGRAQSAYDLAATPSRWIPEAKNAVTGLVEFGKAAISDPAGTSRAIAQGEVQRASQAAGSPEAMGEYAANFIDPLRLAKALRYRAPILELDVYHGTPHRFPATEANPLGEFDASKIGTGEGAQAYGHGIYLAESPGVAKGYAETLANRDSINQNRLNAHANAQRLAKLAGDPKFAADDIKFALMNEPNHPQKDLLQETLSFLENGDYAKPLQNPGHLLKADLPDKMIDRMLDWDKPMSQQPEAVKKILMQDKRLKSLYERGKIDDFYDNAGHFYRIIMAEQRQNAPINLSEEAAERWAEPLASERLRQMGIPGIKYLDAGSRGQGGSGTRNFVVFPGEEKKVRILERK